MAFFDLLENCSHPILNEKVARLVSTAFARGSQSARIAMVLIAAIVSFGSNGAIAQDQENLRQKPSENPPRVTGNPGHRIQHHDQPGESQSNRHPRVAIETKHNTVAERSHSARARRKRERISSMASILLVDDDEQLRTMLSEVLKRAGYEVQTACDGDEAIRMYGSNPTDLVITDLIMPNKEGLETIREIRQDFPTVRIIVMSGGGRSGPANYLALAEKLVAQQVLNKPFSHRNILEAIRGALGE